MHVASVSAAGLFTLFHPTLRDLFSMTKKTTVIALSGIFGQEKGISLLFFQPRGQLHDLYTFGEAREDTKKVEEHGAEVMCPDLKRVRCGWARQNKYIDSSIFLTGAVYLSGENNRRSPSSDTPPSVSVNHRGEKAFLRDA